MEKLSELSKPVMYSIACNGAVEEIGGDSQGFSREEVQAELDSWGDVVHGVYSVCALYSQEYVSALLAELEAKDEALRAIAFHVSAGVYNADSVDAEVFKQKIIDGINGISDVLVKRLAELESANKSQGDHINQQQDRIDSLEKKNGDLGRSLGAAEKRLAKPVRLPDALAGIGEKLRTQDNRITSEPMFCVYQKREIAADAEYDHDRIVWVDEEGLEANERQRMRLELLHDNCREAPEKWRRVAVKEIDEFVTCCFTEQGCKDYLACNGHNLRLPFIYVKSGFRNAEYIALRRWLMTFTVEGDE